MAVRVNPDVEAHTHAKITTGTYENKFGIAFEQVEGVYARASKLKNLRLRGVQMHIGSQLTTVVFFVALIVGIAVQSGMLMAERRREAYVQPPT